MASQVVQEGIKRLQEEYGERFDKVSKIITVDMPASLWISVGWSGGVPQRSTSPIRIVPGSVYRMSSTYALEL